MTVKKAIGYLMIASPFVAIFAAFAPEIGVLPTLAAYAVCGLVIAVVATGCILIEGR